MEKKGVQAKAVCLGLTVAWGFWFVCGVVGLLWVAVSTQMSFNVGILLYLLGIIGVVAGAVVAGSRSNEKGWLHGLWVGLLLALCGVMINLEFVPELYSWAAIGRLLLVWTLWGMTGGYLGAYLRTTGKAGVDKKKDYRRGFSS